MSLILDEDHPYAVMAVLGLMLCAVLAAGFLEPPVRLTIEGGPIKRAPAYVRLRVHVEPDAANRWLSVQIDSGDFLRGSSEALEGERAARTRWIDYRDVPAGQYDVVAIVDRGRARRWVATARFIVVG